MLLAYHIYRIWALPVACISLIACLHSTYNLSLCHLHIIYSISVHHLHVTPKLPVHYLLITFILPVPPAAYHLYLTCISPVSIMKIICFTYFSSICQLISCILLVFCIFLTFGYLFSGTRDELLSMSCDGTVLARVSFPEPGSSHLECFAITSRNEVS